MPKIASHVEIRPNGFFVDGNEFPFYISDLGISVEYDHGVSFVTVRILADAVTIIESVTEVTDSVEFKTSRQVEVKRPERHDEVTV